MPWPSGGISVANVDAGTDVPALSRVDLKNLIDQFNEAILSRGGIDGVCELDANLKIPFNRLSGVEVGSITTASLISGQFDLGFISHSLGTDDVDFGGTVVGNGSNFTFRQTIGANLTGTDGRTTAIGNPSFTGGNVSTAPPSGQIGWAVQNAGQTQQVTLRYWIRRRS